MKLVIRTLNFLLLCPLAVLIAAISTHQTCLADETAKGTGPAKVEVRQESGRWEIYVNGQKFFIKGAGGESSLAKLKEAGANSVRTWGTKGLGSVLDEAQTLGLKVCAGIWLHHERDTEGFDYSDPKMVAEQLEEVRQSVLRFRNHPALLLWGLGNEMEGETGEKAEIWKAVQEAAKLTKQLDPNHPTMTVIAEIGGQKVDGIHKYCPDIDIIGINTYGGGPTVGERYAKSKGTKPYIITEFGPVGPWETTKTSWGAAHEQTSTEKAAWYRKTYEGSILNKVQCLGSYAFLWGHKQETTATWFGMFLKDGTKLQAVDTMRELWSGDAPKNRIPIIKQLSIRGSNRIEPGGVILADFEAHDPQGDRLQLKWVIQPEQSRKLTAGAEELSLPELTDIVIRGNEQHAEIRAPQAKGDYRLFAYVKNGNGAAVANIPFQVANKDNKLAGNN